MGTAHRFHLPSAFRRGKPSVQRQDWPKDGTKHKAQHILGITEAALNTARSESISSSTTAKIPALSFSDATTELGSSTIPPEKPEQTRGLDSKASSVLLHEEFRLKADAATSVRSGRLRECGSSSTLNSHYDSQNTPLVISQQTSDSSRRDFALRKGAAIVIKSTVPEKDSHRQLALFESSKLQGNLETKSLTEPRHQSLNSPARKLFGGQRYSKTSGHDTLSISATSMPGQALIRQSKLQKDVRFKPAPSSGLTNSEKSAPPRAAVNSRHEASHVKTNVRRPTAGAKHWFDGLDGESSQDESIHEPELQESFVAGLQMAFEDGSIGPMSQESSRFSSFSVETPKWESGAMTPKSPLLSSHHLLSPSHISPRVSTLNAKSSKSTLSNVDAQKTSIRPSKSKANSFASKDLRHMSILDLSSSSSDDEPPIREPEDIDRPLPKLRDSIAVESLLESDIEIGMAKTIDTKQNASLQATPSLRRVRGKRSRRGAGLSTKDSNVQHDRKLTYFNDPSSELALTEMDLLTSFPPTPTDAPSSRRASSQASCLSDNVSIESRRLMRVTKQEESLLAAMRMKRAILHQGNGNTTDRRIQVIRDLDRRPAKSHGQMPTTGVAIEVSPPSQARQSEITHSIYSEGDFDQASCASFQTGRSNDQSTRYSVTSFGTDTSIEADSFIGSPGLLSPTYGTRRVSRGTFFSTSTSDSRDTSRSRRGSNYATPLDTLSAVSKRDQVSSQDFIDWPYNGWEAKATLAAAR